MGVATPWPKGAIAALYNYTDSQNETFFVGKFQDQEILKELRLHIPKIIKI